MEKGVAIFLTIIIISAIALFILSLNFFNLTGNVILQPEFSIGENITGTLTIVIDEGDNLNKNLPILISLIKNNTAIKTETLTLEKFIQESDSEIKPINSFYKTPGTFSVNLENFFQFTFNESGEYELLFSVIELNINTKKTFTIV